MDTDCIAVLVTAPGMDAARNVAGAVLGARLAACANILPGVESHYWWKDEIQCDAEVLILFKTRACRFADLRDQVLAIHPYECPEVVALPLADGSARYMEWLRAVVP